MGCGVGSDVGSVVDSRLGSGVGSEVGSVVGSGVGSGVGGEVGSGVEWGYCGKWMIQEKEKIESAVGNEQEVI